MKKIFLIAFILTATLFAQDKSDIIRVIGESLIGKTENGISFREVIGNVVMTQGNVRVTCNKAIQNLTNNNAELIGNVVVMQDSITIHSEKGYYFGNEKYVYSNKHLTLEDGHVELTADSGYYYFDLKKSIFNSNVKLVDSVNILNSNKLTYFNDNQKVIAVGKVNISDEESSIFCDSLIHFREQKKSNAYNNVKIVNEKQQLTIIGEELVDEGMNNYTRITGNPLLTKIDTTESGKEDTLFIRAKVFEAKEDSVKTLLAIDSVKIIRGDLFSVNNYAILYRDENRLMTKKMKGDKNSPILWFTNSQLVGDSINIFLSNSKLDSIQIRNDATILSKNKNYEYRYEQISGDKINMYFRDGKLKLTNVDGGVLSIYFMYEKNEPNGLIKSSSNKAKMMFENNEVVNVSMYEAVQSEYHPEKLVKGNELDFTIPTFIIYKNKPMKAELIQRSK
ncbi:MAG: LPS export ABC transporter periplasmic protein LptC [Bacteroidetes bacterium]|nr:LPS export ABC transporter periplasmic protein LptC [Bacteroidota bacterium]MBU1116202.1 LPS export ABC transporter periplasmic protein LptC [Bacteroidota bacterium]MBU1799876.1 LPS export ABC transporter periplasmic protein LptC [Bacteroidota bacterium]